MSGEPIWSVGRKWMGNLIPALFSVPVLILALWLYQKQGLSSATWVTLCAFPGVAWVSVGLFGLYANEAMREAMAQRLQRARAIRRDAIVFVGAATPAYRSALDPHEDVGFLIFDPDALEFFGEKLQLTITREQIQAVRLRMNPHSVLGLGGWVSIEGLFGGEPGRFLIESRNRGTLFGNRWDRRRLLARIRAWHESQKESDPSSEEPGPATRRVQ